jgi:hypothetical protein
MASLRRRAKRRATSAGLLVQGSAGQEELKVRGTGRGVGDMAAVQVGTRSVPHT